MTINAYLIATWTLLYKEARRSLRLWVQTILPSAITTVLYFVIFGHVIGSRIGEMQGYSYIQYIAPGLIMMSMITSSYSATVGALFIMRFDRSIEQILISPVPNFFILIGYVAAGMFRGLIVGTIVAIIAVLFTHLHLHSLLAIISMSLLSSAIFATAGVINAVYAKKFDDIAFVPTFVLTPMTYFGGVFYSVSLLPPVWQTISMFNPIVYIIDTFRFGFLGVMSAHIVGSFVAMTAFLILLFGGALWLLARGVGLRD